MRNHDMLNHDIISTIGSRTKLDRRSKKDTWQNIILLLTGKSKEWGSLTSRTRDMQNHEITLAIRSKFDLDQLI
jgi:hypothetical protein